MSAVRGRGSYCRVSLDRTDSFLWTPSVFRGPAHGLFPYDSGVCGVPGPERRSLPTTTLGPIGPGLGLRLTGLDLPYRYGPCLPVSDTGRPTPVHLGSGLDQVTRSMYRDFF